MRRLLHSSALSALAAISMLVAASSAQAVVLVAPPISTNPYVEIPDAGDRNNPQFISGGPYDGFIGDIGGPDAVDAFGFGWGGGAFSATAAFNQMIPYMGPPMLMIEEEYVIMPLFEVLRLTLFTADLTMEKATGISSIQLPDLLPGNYILEVTTTMLVDPPFTVGVTGPVMNPVLPFQVPEPGTLALFGLGLAGLGFARRRKAA